MSLLEKSKERWAQQCEEYAKDNVAVPKDRIKWSNVAKAVERKDLKEELSTFIRRELLKEEPETVVSINSDICDDCGVQMIVIANDSMLACARCGKTRVIASVHAWNSSMDSDFSTMNVNQKSRLLEWLEFAQAKEYGDIPAAAVQEVVSTIVRHKLSGLEVHGAVIRTEYEKNGPYLSAEDAIERLRGEVPNIEDLLKAVDSIAVRNVIKNCSECKRFIDRSAKFASILSGYYPERLTADMEQYIRKLFMAATPVYDRYRKASQPNWPGGYAYFLRCLLILLGWDEIAALFPIQITGRNAEREEMRREIWAILQWENVSSVAPLSPVRLPDGSVLDGSILARADKNCKITSRGYDFEIL
jgi:hypothetical protein